MKGGDKMTVKCDYDKETTFKAKFQHKGNDGSLIIVYVPIEEIQKSTAVRCLHISKSM